MPIMQVIQHSTRKQTYSYLIPRRNRNSDGCYLVLHENMQASNTWQAMMPATQQCHHSVTKLLVDWLPASHTYQWTRII